MPTLDERVEAVKIVFTAILPYTSRHALDAAASEVRGQLDAMDNPAERRSRELALKLIATAEAGYRDGEEVAQLAKALDAMQLLDKAVDALVRDFAGPDPTADQLDQLAGRLVTKPTFLTIVGDLDMARALGAILCRRAVVMRASKT